MEKNEQLKWVPSKDGNIRFLLSIDAPDCVENFIYQPERSKREDLNKSINPSILEDSWVC